VTTLAQAVGDGAVITKRNLLKIKRVPEILVFATLSPIMFVLLFAFIFGSAIPLPGVDYKEFLMAGIFTQTVVFGSTLTGASLAEDLQKGLIDRFRSLPMARSAVLTGRSFSDAIYQTCILCVLMVTGLLVGWSVSTGVVNFLIGVALLVAFAFTMSWVGIWLGLSVPTVEVGQQVTFVVIFPITFISSAFVPIQTMPSWLQPFAEWNPVSTLTTSLRVLWGNPNPFATNNLPSQQPILVTIGWLVVLLGLFIPMGVRKYRSTSR